MSKIIRIRDLSSEVISKAHASVKSLYFNSIGCLYHAEAENKARHAGTCSFFRRGKRQYLVTAKHVMEHSQYRNIYILTPEHKLAPLELQGFQTEATAPGRIDHKDIYFSELSATHSSWTKSFSFIDIDAAHENSLRSTNEIQMIGLLGFPTSKNKPNNYTFNIVAQPYIISGRPRRSDPLLQANGFTDNSHVFMHYKKRKARAPNGEIRRALKPHGLSGGLMIDLGISGEFEELLNGPKRMPTPIGITTDLIDFREYVAGTKINVIHRIFDGRSG